MQTIVNFSEKNIKLTQIKRLPRDQKSIASLTLRNKKKKAVLATAIFP
jgi:hypothetical protein